MAALWIKLTISKTRTETSSYIGFSGINLYDASNNLITVAQMGTRSTSKSGSGSLYKGALINLIDNDAATYVTYKDWGANKTIEFLFGFENKILPAKYSLVTTSEGNGRDPITWKLEYKYDGDASYKVASEVNDANVPTERKAETGHFDFNNDLVPKYSLKVVDAYYSINDVLINSVVRNESTEGKGYNYSFSALEDEDYTVIGSDQYTGTLTEDTLITFKYREVAYFTLSVFDDLYDIDGRELETSNLRYAVSKLGGETYQVNSSEYVGYSLIGKGSYSGKILGNTDIRFKYKKINAKKSNALNIIALDDEYQIISLLSYTNLQWSRKYRECGTFSIQIPLEQYDSSIKYIYTNDRPEMGEVTQVNYQESNGYKSISLSGYFLEAELDRHIVYRKGTTNITNDPGFDVQSGKAEDVAYAYFQGFKKISGTNIDGTVWSSTINIGTTTSLGRGHNSTHHRNGEYLGRKLYNILRPSKMSYRVRFDFEDMTKTLEVWSGLDRTQGNRVNNPVIFSTLYGNVINPNIVIDDSTYKNAAIVTNEYTTEAEKEYTVQAYCDPSDVNATKYFVSVDSTLNKTDFTATDFRKELENEGENEVTNAEQTINLDFDALSGSYDYRIDFDIGDICSIEIPEIGFSANAQLIGCYEVIKSGDWSLSLEFGTPI